MRAHGEEIVAQTAPSVHFSQHHSPIGQPRQRSALCIFRDCQMLSSEKLCREMFNTSSYHSYSCLGLMCPRISDTTGLERVGFSPINQEVSLLWADAPTCAFRLLCKGTNLFVKAHQAKHMSPQDGGTNQFGRGEV